MHLNIVDLPDSKALLTVTASPWFTVKLISLRTLREPNDFSRFSIFNISDIIWLLVLIAGRDNMLHSKIRFLDKDVHYCL